MADDTNNQPPKQPTPYKKKEEKPVAATTVAGATETVPAREKVAAKHLGFDATRPIRYLGAFVNGTISRTLDGMGHGGQIGLRLGILIGLTLWFAPALFAGSVFAGSVMAFTGAAAGGTAAAWSFIGTMGVSIFGTALAGIGIGGGMGLITGGAKGIGREYRKEKYADDLATKEDVAAVRHRRGITYQDVYTQSRLNANYNYDRMLQAARENRHDEHTYWRDRVDHERMGGPHHGQGF